LVDMLAGHGTDFGTIRGLSWRRGEEIICNAARPLIPDIDSLPLPARDLAPAKSYSGWFLTRQQPDSGVMFSRGCRFNCTFCANAVFHRSLRLRSPENILQELGHLHADHGVREFFDVSDEFNSDTAHALAVCDAIQRSKLNMTWKSQVRADNLSEALVKAMAAAGCWYVQIGIESGNERTLRGTGKGVRHDEIERACRLFRQYGIKVFGLFMLFNAWEEDRRLVYEGLRETRRTLAYARRLHSEGLIHYISWSMPMPWPGSRLFEIANRFGIMREDVVGDWERWHPQGGLLLDLPNVSRTAVRAMYFEGALYRAWYYLLSGEWNLKGVPDLGWKTMRAIEFSLETILRRPLAWRRNRSDRR
jgi:anaerobic magnesium-protoporphyrin IX monomethyl ester cyclase